MIGVFTCYQGGETLVDWRPRQSAIKLPVSLGAEVRLSDFTWTFWTKSCIYNMFPYVSHFFLFMQFLSVQTATSQELPGLQWCHKTERIYQSCRAPRPKSVDALNLVEAKRGVAAAAIRTRNMSEYDGEAQQRRRPCRTKTRNLAITKVLRNFNSNHKTSTLSNRLVEKTADAARGTQYPGSGHLIFESTAHGKACWHVEKMNRSSETDPFSLVSPGSATLPGTTSWHHSFQKICLSDVDSPWEPRLFVQSS